MIGDEDGIVVVPATRISETIENLDVVRAAEAAVEAKSPGEKS
jgi:regulator of RNase E activity RraA